MNPSAQIRRQQRIAPVVREQLNQRFPRTFKGKGDQKAPLKIGIFRDLIAACPDLPRCHIRYALWDYTRGPTYLRNVNKGTPRLDLEGNTSSFVTAEDADYATTRLKRLQRPRRALQKA